MYIKLVKPIRDRIKYSAELTKLLQYDIFQLIYKPLIDLLDTSAKQNAKDSVLIAAFSTRTIWFNDGFVYGKFSAAISKALGLLGARFNKPKKAFKIELSQIPIDIRAAMAKGTTSEQDAIDRMKKKAMEISPNNVIIPGTVGIAGGTIADLHSQFEKLTPQDLEIPVAMHGAMEEKMIADYTASVHLSVQDLASDAVYRMRQRV